MEFKNTSTFSISDIPGLSFKCFDGIAPCHSDWDLASFRGPNVLLKASYLSTLSENFESDMHQYYVIFYMEDKVVGRALFQCGLWEADSSYADEAESQNSSFSLKNWFAKKVRFIGILCGNILLTGEYGFDFEYSKVDKNRVPFIIGEAANAIQESYYKDSKYPSAVIGKDLMVTKELNEDWTQQGFHRFKVQPNMILKLDADWKNFDDYLASLSSKYRVRAKRAYKKSNDIHFKEMNVEEIEANLETLFSYFKSVQKNAGFNLVYLKPNYFLELKKRLGDKYRLYGYYLDGRLIGFNTLIINHDELEAHFLGFDREVNITHQLYLTMLYDKIKKAIGFGSKRIIYARTALEIKSSVGAEPEELCIYLRHENSLLNKFISPIIGLLNPREEWVQRHPFKEKEV